MNNTFLVLLFVAWAIVGAGVALVIVSNSDDN